MADRRARQAAELIKPLRVKPGTKVTLAKDFDPGYKAGFLHKKDGKQLLHQGVELLEEYQTRLAAQDSYGLLVVLQALDAGGKDGTIRHVMSGVNPQGVDGAQLQGARPPRNSATTSCGGTPSTCRPGARSASSTGRTMRRCSSSGSTRRTWIASGSRPRPRGKGVWHRRYREINDWERYLSDNGFRIVKLFLNLSKEEQRTRFMKRLDLPEKNWKFSANDIAERQYWDDYQQAFSEMLSQTSTSVGTLVRHPGRPQVVRRGSACRRSSRMP